MAAVQLASQLCALVPVRERRQSSKREGQPMTDHGGYRLPELRKICRVRRDRRIALRVDQTVVIWLVRAANQLLMLLPNTVTTPINSTATSATSRPYSVTAMPSSAFMNLVTVLNPIHLSPLMSFVKQHQCR